MCSSHKYWQLVYAGWLKLGGQQNKYLHMDRMYRRIHACLPSAAVVAYKLIPSFFSPFPSSSLLLALPLPCPPSPSSPLSCSFLPSCLLSLLIRQGHSKFFEFCRSVQMCAEVHWKDIQRPVQGPGKLQTFSLSVVILPPSLYHHHYNVYYTTE